jgi:hypothetical protein
MKILTFNNIGGVTGDPDVINESHFTRTSASVTDGKAVIKRKLFFIAEADDEDAVDILSLEIFPKKYSAHPKHSAYKYYGNASIEPLSERSKIWVAELEYSTTNPSSGSGGKNNDGTAETIEPWKLAPDNISLNAAEITVPFKQGYFLNEDLGFTVLKNVCNSAGDMYEEQKTARNLELSFSYAVKSWNSNNLMKYTNSTNSDTITVAGVTIPANCGVLKNLSPTFVTVYEENSTKIKWTYWQVSVTIIIDNTGTIIKREFLDVGDRAKFFSINIGKDQLLTDAQITNTILPISTPPSQICRFRLTQNIAGTGEPAVYAPTGDIVMCSWEQYLAAAKLYQEAAKIVGRKNESARNYMPEVEQMQKMPLDGSGFLFEEAIDGLPAYNGSEYKTRVYYENEPLSWAPLNLPTKGIE